MSQLALIGIAGALGALARYGLALVVQRAVGTEFPWGILSVNVLGCLLFGLIYGLAEERGIVRPELRAIALIGFLGAFTTFSTFAFDTLNLVRAERYVLAGANIVLGNALGVVAVLAGLALSRLR
ncbi:MAG: fluoride efflux transporter CrcB [SAR202 cluster bacterium]|nr:fluoride efflux transporter CrcB [SAR202 cluster bacterium]